MNKQTILLVLGGAIFLVLIMMFIRMEGERFREQVKETADTSVRDGMNEAAENAAEKVVDRAADRIEGALNRIPGNIFGADTEQEEADDSEGKESPEDSESTKADNDKQGESSDSKSTDATVPSESKPEQSTDGKEKKDEPSDSPSTEKSGKSSGKKEKKKKGGGFGIGSIFDLGNEVVKQADRVGQEFVKLTVEEENEIGDQIHDHYRRELKISTNPEDSKRLKNLAQPFLKHIEDDGTVYSFYVVEDKHINAFTHIGGHVYFFRGLLDLLQTDQRIQFVLGHEIAHGELEHSVKGMAYSARAGQLGGSFGADMVGTVHQTLTQGYSDDEEFDADEWSCRKMIEEGGTRADVVDSLGMLLKYEKQRDQKSGADSKTDDGDDGLSREIDGHFRSHPSTQERIDRILNQFPEE